MTRKRERHPLESFCQPIVQKYVAKRYGCVAVPELNFRGPKFDVVGFSPDAGEFYIVMCKRTTRPVGVGQTFGQILAYKAMITDAGEKFLDSFNRKLVKEGITKLQFWQHGAQFVDTGRIPVRFFVALSDQACQRIDILQSIKKDLGGVGIIRINKYNKCRDYIRIFHDKDDEICRAARVEVPISMPLRAPVKAVLDHGKADRRVAHLAGILDHKVMRMRMGRIRSVTHGRHSIFYRLRHNFAGFSPKQHHLRVAIRERDRWQWYTVTREQQFRKMMSRAKDALDRTMG